MPFLFSSILIDGPILESNEAIGGGGGAPTGDFPETVMSANQSSAWSIPYTIVSNNVQMQDNSALFGNSRASSPYALLQTSGAIESNTISYGDVSSSAASTDAIVSGGIDSPLDDVKFSLVDFYGQICKNEDLGTVEIDRNAIVVDEGSMDDEGLSFVGTFIGSRTAKFETGEAVFAQLAAEGKPGATYSASIFSTLSGRVLTKLQLTLRQCQSGEYVESTTGNCISCPAGYASPSANMLECNACALGKFQTMQRSSCKNCTAGRSQSLLGQKECISCLAGFASAEGSDSCHACSTGRFSATEEASTCADCATGRYSLVGSSSCKGCAQGKIAIISSSNENTGCDECPNGWATTGDQLSCTACLSGFYAPKGSFKCEKCIAGMYSRKSMQHVSTVKRICTTLHLASANALRASVAHSLSPGPPSARHARLAAFVD